MKWLGKLYSKIKSQKTPLTLAVVAQASTIAVWMTMTGKTGFPVLNLIIASIAAFSIDLIIVSTAFSEKRSTAAWILALATSTIALIFSSAIAVYLFNDTNQPLTPWNILHAAFPILVYFYSWFLSIIMHDRDRLVIEQAERERMREFEQVPLTVNDYRAMIIRRLLLRKMTVSPIYEIVGGNKQKMLELIRTLQNELGIEEEPEETE